MEEQLESDTPALETAESRDLKRAALEKLEAAKDSAACAARATREKFEEVLNYVRTHNTAAIQDDLTQVVQQRPGTVLIASAMAGFAAGMLVRELFRGWNRPRA